MTSTAEPHRVQSAVAWDGEALLNAFSLATSLLRANQSCINDLNVFPVPDGDTGTNMGLTMQAAVDEAARATGEQRQRAGGVAKRIEFGSLMGAKGNSGVILSQIFRGFAKEVASLAEIDGRDFARALGGARDMAYKAVMEPVEGTMLTVIRIAAEHAERAAAESSALEHVSAEALAGAKIALAKTPELLAKLREAGVVDAGGQGVVYLLEGLDKYARGESFDPNADQTTTAAAGSAMAFLDRVEEFHGEDAYGYCTNFMIFGADIPFDRVRAEIAAMGDSAVIVGDDTTVKVHIHTENPGQLLQYAISWGELGQIKIDNMSSQVRTLMDGRASAAAAPESAWTSGPGLLAVAAGEGIASILRSMGVSGIIEGGQTMNPSIEQLLSAVERHPAAEVLLLPNNPNILLAANHVPELASKPVRIVPAKSIPQAIAALSTFDPDADLDTNAEEMSALVDSVRTAEVTRASKDASINGLHVTKGQFIGLVDDRMVAAGDDEIRVACETLDAAGAANCELITVFTGDGLRPDGIDDFAAAVSSAFPGAELELHDGGQPHYRYVIAVE